METMVNNAGELTVDPGRNRIQIMFRSEPRPDALYLLEKHKFRRAGKKPVYRARLSKQTQAIGHKVFGMSVL